MAKKYKFLTDEQVECFMQNGYVKLEGAITPEKVAEWTQDIWIRLGMDPNDKSTWTREWTNMPVINSEKIETFSPPAYGAMLELIGGADRLRKDREEWGDNFIVNLGEPDFWGKEPPHPRDLTKWHCDGNYYVHFLDSPEVALLMIPLFSDVASQGGCTFITSDGLTKVIHHLADHPDGVGGGKNGFNCQEMVRNSEHFIEVTGKAGDVYMCHPFMLHTASQNNTAIPRFMINPWAALNEPHQYKRDNVDDYSLVELKTLKDLGKTPEEGYDFKPLSPRRDLFDKSQPRGDQLKWRAEELERLAKAGRAPKQVSALAS